MKLDRYEIKSGSQSLSYEFLSEGPKGKIQKLIMKTLLDLNQTKVPLVRIDKSLDKYDDVVLFPEKMAKAKKAFEKLGLPDLTKPSR